LKILITHLKNTALKAACRIGRLCVGRTIPFTQIVILNEAQRSEEPPCTNTGVSTREFLATLGMTLVIYLLFSSYSFAQFTKPSGKYFRMPDNITSKDYLPNTIIFKVKPEFRAVCRKNAIDYKKLNLVLQQLGIDQLAKKFPNKKAPSPEGKGIGGETLTDLSLIYELNYSAELPLQKAITRLYSTGMIEYAQPHYLPKPLYTPNDPLLINQYYLTNIQAFAGWDTSKGDTNIVIGIVDTGTDIDHPDLQGNIKYNYADTIDGIDNDGDGFIDNYRGWDLGENDNDPSTSGDWGHHGVYVSGIAAAATDNAIGVAGVGFKCKFLPVKVNKDLGKDFSMAYEGIVYAADHGCRIINCSWGGTLAGLFEQDIINYATINRNSLIIAAAGNNGDESVFYPASYNYVISVAGTDYSDVKTASSNYGIYIDVCTPGDDIYTTMNYVQTITDYGPTGEFTSFAAPIAAGCAAIIASHLPTYTALQVGEQLKVTADNIDTLSGNIPFAGKLGSGRINLYRALTETSSPSIVMTQKNIADGNDDVFKANDTLSISGIFTNYLAPTSNLTVTLTSSSPYVNIINSTVNLGAIATLATADNNANPFTVAILDSIPYNVPIELKLNYNDGSYTGFEYIGLVINSDYVNIAINDVATTITSNSRIGYNEDLQVGGLGFTYLGEQLLYEAGFMIGDANTRVSDNIRGNSGLNNDFALVAPARKVIPAVVSDFDVEGIFNDDSAGVGKLNVLVEHKAFAWNSPEDAKYIIVEYNIINNSSGTLNGLYAGIFADWDIMNPFLNRASFDAFNKMGYVYSTEPGSPYAGIKLLTQGSITHYAIDNLPGGGGGIDISNGYSTAEKFLTLSVNRTNAGVQPGGNDVMDVVGTGPFNLLQGDTVIVAFALIAGDDLAQLRASAQAAQVKYDEYASPGDPQGVNNQSRIFGNQLKVYPNPSSGVFVLTIYDLRFTNGELTIYDVLGQVLQKAAVEGGSRSQKFEINLSAYPAGIYHLQLITDKSTINKKIVIE